MSASDLQSFALFPGILVAVIAILVVAARWRAPQISRLGFIVVTAVSLLILGIGIALYTEPGAAAGIMIVLGILCSFIFWVAMLVVLLSLARWRAFVLLLVLPILGGVLGVFAIYRYLTDLEYVALTVPALLAAVGTLFVALATHFKR